MGFQLLKFSWIQVLILVSQGTFLVAQNIASDSTANKYIERELREIEVKFLGSYYEQDGDHSPVLGGTGTEYLTDQVGKITINIPLKKEANLTVKAGIDHYTSASTDNINPSSISSASVEDDRGYFSLAYSKEANKNGFGWGINTGFSTEWDVNSFSGGFNLSKSFNLENSQLQFSFQHFSDRWSLIFPVELRNNLPLDSVDWRYVYDGSLTYSQVISKKMQASFSFGTTYQSGFLSTPFHRVYFAEEHWPRIENLPRSRMKFPMGLRLNYFPVDYLITRLYYRYYFDDFGIKSHTASVEIPIKPSPFFSIIPFYRFSTQTSSKYFAEIDTHTSNEEFYTSDYDLSGFQSHKYGIGLRVAPVNGILNLGLRNSRKGISFDKIETRAAIYHRSDGLKAWIITLSITSKLKY